MKDPREAGRGKKATQLLAGVRPQMDIAYRTRKLRGICLSDVQMKNTFGKECAAALQNFLADLRAAHKIGDIFYDLLNDGDDSDESALKFDVDGHCSVFITPNHNRIPTNNRGEVDWTKVTRVQIRKIEQ